MIVGNGRGAGRNRLPFRPHYKRLGCLKINDYLTCSHYLYCLDFGLDVDAGE